MNDLVRPVPHGQIRVVSDRPTVYQKRGFKDDDLFRVVRENTYHAPHQVALGSLIKLDTDDNTDWPAFTVVIGTSRRSGIKFIELDALEVVRE